MKKTIFSAVFIISLFTIADRFLGFVFKIFLSRELGAESLGVYQVALSFFFVLLTATTSGIPLIVSKLTAKYRIEGNVRRERALTCAALLVGLVISIVICGGVILLQKPLGAITADEESTSLLLFMLPALVFSAVYAALRGNLWGRQRYFTVSLVEVLEQIARILGCVLLFYLGFNKLKTTAFSMSIGCFVSMLTVIFFFLRDKGRLASPKGEIVPLLKSSTPITVSRAASSLVSSLTAIAVPFLLTASGFTRSEALAHYGASVGMAMPLLYIPITIVGSLAFVMIPTIATSVSKGEKSKVNTQIKNAISFSIILAATFVPMFSAVGKEIGIFIYDSALSGRFLSCSAWLLIPLAVENITSSTMNSLDLEVRSFFNYLTGAAVTFVICFAFYGNFTVEAFSLAQGIGWTLSTILHVLSIRKKTGLGFSFVPKLLICIAIIIPTTFLTEWLHSLFMGTGQFLSIAISSTIGILFFAALTILFGLVNVNTVRTRPKKRKNTVKTLAKSK